MAWYSDVALVPAALVGALFFWVFRPRKRHRAAGVAIGGVLAVGIVAALLLAVSLPTGVLAQDAPPAAPPGAIFMSFREGRDVCEGEWSPSQRKGLHDERCPSPAGHGGCDCI